MKALVGVSGGIDSFFTTKLLMSEGYDVSIYTFKFWQFQNYYDVEKRIEKIKEYLKVDYYIAQTEDYFYKTIVQYFINEYLSGKTPNICVVCNSDIKYKLLYEYSEDKNIDFIATGHYANVNYNNGRYYISKGIDNTKDQSYFLWKVPQKYLKKTILPLGKYLKKDIKAFVTDEEKMILDKRESNDVCFLGKYKYTEFLKITHPELIEKTKNGFFIYENRVVGKHNGYFNFTIGQRKGINVALGFPVYVKKIDSQSNTVYLCREEDIYLSEFSVKNINYQKYESVPDGFECEVKVRYRSCSEKCKIYIQNNIVTVKLESPQKSICPGQSAVFYEGNDVVLGGIIT